MSAPVASQVSSSTLASEFIVTTDSVRVDGILVSHLGGANHELTIQDNDGNTYFTITIGANSSFWIGTAWIAENGLKVAAEDSDTRITFYHSASGA